MKRLWQQMKNKPLWYGLFSLLFLFLLISRYAFLTTVPTSLSHDEMIYALNAQSVASSGTDITGQWKPWSLTPVHRDFAELPVVLMAPFFWLPVSPLFAAKLPFVLMSIALPFLLSALGKRVTGSREVGIAVVVLATLNPWLWQTGRLTFDVMFSLFFFVSAALAFLSMNEWKKMWALPLFFIGFYQYQGYKLLFLPWVFGLTAFLMYEKWQQLPEKKRHWKQMPWAELKPVGVIVGVCVLLFAWYLGVQLPSQASQERVSAIITPNSEVVRLATDAERRVSLETSWNRFFINKYVMWVDHLIGRLVAVYSPTYWFLQGQANVSAFSVWSHGSFYVLDSVLFLIGMVVMARRQRWLLAGVLVGMAIAPLPALLANQEWFYFRASLAIPFFLLVMGTGLAEVAKSWPKMLQVVIVGAYAVMVMQFMYQFFVRYPVYSSARHYFVDKVVSEYAFRLPEDRQVMIVSPEPEFTFKSLVFYHDVLMDDSADTTSQIQQAFRDRHYSYRNIQLSSDCYRPSDFLDTSKTWVVRVDAPVCEDAEEQVRSLDHLSFAAVEDSGEVYFVYNDPLCNQTALNTYLRVIHLGQFNLPELADSDFCRSWMTDLRPLRKEQIEAQQLELKKPPLSE